MSNESAYIPFRSAVVQARAACCDEKRNCFRSQNENVKGAVQKPRPDSSRLPKQNLTLRAYCWLGYHERSDLKNRMQRLLLRSKQKEV